MSLIQFLMVVSNNLVSFNNFINFLPVFLWKISIFLRWGLHPNLLRHQRYENTLIAFSTGKTSAYWCVLSAILSVFHWKLVFKIALSKRYTYHTNIFYYSNNCTMEFERMISRIFSDAYFRNYINNEVSNKFTNSILIEHIKYFKSIIYLQILQHLAYRVLQSVSGKSKSATRRVRRRHDTWRRQRRARPAARRRRGSAALAAAAAHQWDGLVDR